MQIVRKMSLLAYTSLLTACTTNHVDDQYAKDYLNRCFTTRSEAIFLSRECHKGSWTYCDTARPILATVHIPGSAYPPTLQAFHDDPEGWSHRIQENEKSKQPPLEPDHIIIYGGLPERTNLKIVSLQSVFDGENGARLISYAEIQDGEFSGRRLLLPEGNNSFINWQYLERCAERKL
jgi:hypothetical protein